MRLRFSVRDPVPIYTIGYGQRSFDEFAALLKRYGVQYLIDTRSVPHSRWRHEFNQGALREAVEREGVRYLYMGDVIGGKPADPACRRDGRVDYALVRRQEWFQRGIDRLERALRQDLRIAIMCAEQKPEHCHRTHLIAAELIARNLPVSHIDESGELQLHEAILRRIDGGQMSLLGGRLP